MEVLESKVRLLSWKMVRKEMGGENLVRVVKGARYFDG